MRLLAIEPDPSKNREVCAALLYRRALQTFQGSILLAELGMIADALTLLRSCAETAIAIGGCAADEKFIDRLIEDDANHRITYANVMLGNSSSSPPLTSEQVSNLQKVVSAINSEYSNLRPKSINWADTAIKVGMRDLYDMIYRWTSGGATHVTINALDRHVMPKPNQHLPYPRIIQTGQFFSQPLTLTFQPETRDLVVYLSGATSAILHAMKALSDIFPQKGIEESVKHHLSLWSELIPPESTPALHQQRLTPESAG